MRRENHVRLYIWVSVWKQAFVIHSVKCTDAFETLIKQTIQQIDYVDIHKVIKQSLNSDWILLLSVLWWLK